MDFKMSNIIVVISLSFLISGCATKKEVISLNNDSMKQRVILDKEPEIDSKNNMAAQSDGSLLNDEIVSTITDGQNERNKVVDNMYNTTTSKINGEDVVLKSIHFDFDMYTLTEDNLVISADNSAKINKISSKDSSFKIKLEGNCDEWGTDEYNYALSLKRTNVVKNDLINRGISADRIVTLSYGESNPICKEQTAECWMKNRRVDHYLVP
jgi:peptidoglycan-associated lipoprotein